MQQRLNAASAVGLFFILFYFCTCSSRVNLLSNGGFENGLKDWQTGSWLQPLQVEVTTGKVHSGQQALRIDSGEQENHIFIFREITLQPDTFYRFSAWVATEGIKEAGGGVKLALHQYMKYSQMLSGTRDWVRISMVFKTGSRATPLKLSCDLGMFAALSSGVFYLDDVELVCMSTAPAGEYYQLETQAAGAAPDGSSRWQWGRLFVPVLILLLAGGLVTGCAVWLRRAGSSLVADRVRSWLTGPGAWLNRYRQVLAGHRQDIINLLLLAFFYFLLCSGWQDTIEFGYDQARLSMLVMNVIEQGDFWDAGSHIFSSINPNLMTFGPFYTWFMIPFFLISRNPIVITQLLIIFSFTGIIFSYLAAKLLHGRRVAFFTGAFLTTFPWAVIFTRMIYNLSPLVCFIPLVFYLTLLIVKRRRQKLLLILPMVYGMMVQFHFLSVVVAGISFLYLIVHFRQLKWRYLLIGLLPAIIPWIPSIRLEFNTDFRFIRGIFSAREQLGATSSNFMETAGLIFSKTFHYLGLNGIDSHLGYGKPAFFRTLPALFHVFRFCFAWMIPLSLIATLAGFIRRRRFTSLSLLLWFFAVPCFLIFFNITQTLAPRYFLVIQLPLALMLGWTLERGLAWLLKLPFLKKIKKPREQLISRGMTLFSSCFLLCFSIFMIAYHSFILLFDYPEVGFFGWLHPDSAPPYHFMYQSLSYAREQTAAAGHTDFIFSTNLEVTNEYHSTYIIEYIRRHVLHKQLKYREELPFFFIHLGPLPEQLSPADLQRFGPYRVFRRETLPKTGN